MSLNPFTILVSKYLGGQIRHILSGLGLVLVAKGIAEPAAADAAVSANAEIAIGAISYAVAAIASAYQKWKENRKK